MSGLKQLRTRISTVQSTQKMTSAMKMVAAAKLRRAQTRLDHVIPFSSTVDAATQMALSACDLDQIPDIFKGRNTLPQAFVFITADRGMCGSFSTNVMREFRKCIEKHPNFKVVALGKKGRDMLKREYPKHMIHFDGMLDASNLNINDFETVADRLMEMLGDGDIGNVTLISNRFHSVIQQQTEYQSLIPLPFHTPFVRDKSIIFEQKKSKFIPALLKKFLTTRMYHMYLESITGENAARMTAMDGATRNAQDMIKSLRLKYNRTRQAIITKELIEIISGAEAL